MSSQWSSQESQQQQQQQLEGSADTPTTTDELQNMTPISAATPDETRHESIQIPTLVLTMPFVSVLNTVVDFDMMDPTPLFEPNEFEVFAKSQSNNNKSNEDNALIQVPVLRIFGPLIRGHHQHPHQISPSSITSSSPATSPTRPRPQSHQSACLYIHNAFPYLLARPVLAGPDGSSTNISILRNDADADKDDDPVMEGGEETDWDDPESVQRVVPLLHQTLESAIQTTFEDNQNNNANNSNKRSTTAETPARKSRHPHMIRQITVVMGRGFYTYCSGPAAPFLRVEYYNPALRWKVKRLLERGLTGLPRKHHPKDHSSDCYHDEHDEDDEEVDDGPLRFHCYEAHIPYTMQFFKDFNLAGMSYIHLARRSCLSLSGQQSNGDVSVKLRPPLARNIWRRQGEPSSSDTDGAKAKKEEDDDSCVFLQSNTPGDCLWNPDGISHDNNTGQQDCVRESLLRKETSCEVELDVSVEHILNVSALLTETNDRQTPWRAVPSLREIWRQERRRMARLLPSHQNSGNNNRGDQPFTLEVKPNTSAVEGMKQLFGCSMGLEEEFTRSIRQIVNRYKESVDRIDQRFVAQRRQIAGPTYEEKEDEEALGALNAFGSQFKAYEHDVGGVSAATAASGIQEGKSPLQPSSNGLSQLFQSQVGDGEEEEDDNWEESAALFSQKVDRGESIAANTKFEHIEDYIDPETLTPFDEPDDDEDSMDEQQFVQMLQKTQVESTQQQQQQQQQQRSAHQSHGVLSQGLSQANRDLFSRESFEMSVGDESVEESDRTSSSKASSAELSTGHAATEAVRQDSATSTASVGEVIGKWIEPRMKPPTRSEIRMRVPGSQRLERVERRRRGPPSWLKLSSAYERKRTALVNPNPADMVNLGREAFVTPVARAPSRATVQAWCAKQNKKDSKPKEVKGKEGTKRATNSALEIDDNSRKLTAMGKGTRKRAKMNGHGKGTGGVQDIEEVVWGLTQAHSQLSPMDEENVKPDRNSNQKKARQTKFVDQNAATPRSGKSNSSGSKLHSRSQESEHALDGIGAQGGRIYVEGGGGLKAKTQRSPQRVLAARQALPDSDGIGSLGYPTPLTVMSIEIHVQCRKGRAGVNDSKDIAMKPNSDKDKVSSVVYISAVDPGGGEAMRILERGCIYVPVEAELKDLESIGTTKSAKRVERAVPGSTMGVNAGLSVQVVKDERQLLLRLASVVRWKDPDMLVSWDTQGSGLGYLIERGIAVGQEGDNRDEKGGSGGGDKKLEIDLARLLGRTPTAKKEKTTKRLDTLLKVNSGGSEMDKKLADKSKGESGETSGVSDRWKGSGLGQEWDERVGAGAAAASVSGRLVFAGWKLIAEEVKHPNASYQPAMVSTVLSKRIPFHDDLKLTEWYSSSFGRDRWRVISHRLTQAMATLLMLDALDIIGRAGEAARLSGVEFSQSFPGIRGSQYKVEGVLLRALKSIHSDERGSKKGLGGAGTANSLSSESRSQSQSPWKIRRGLVGDGPVHDVRDRSYFFYSPSINDTNKQEALECQALTLEPQSGYEEDPVVVCDFTALYPSLVIAYNLCYSTCAGKLDYHSTRHEMRREGRTTGKLGPFRYAESRTATVLQHHLPSAQDMKGSRGTKFKRDRAYAVPTGSIYVSEAVLKGVLPQVLDELLSTRAMLKKAAKQYKKSVPDLSPAVLRQLEARQLALKYVANVTYGYTSATFSGRCAMPLLADTIVECGRRTLTNAMNLANEWGRDRKGCWFGAEVIYGDTDSVFVRLPGRTVKEAFQFGEEFCAAVTAMNPPPIQLKLEKVYKGCILQTKKKYCGMKFESKDQKKPVFEAKGIETIRRDQCALTQKILRNSLVMLFSRGIDAVKQYLFRQ